MGRGLGADDAANVFGPQAYSGTISYKWAIRLTAVFVLGAVLGGIAIAIGVITYSRNVMETVGKGITVLDPFSALVTIISAAGILHIFAQVGIPVSSSQAAVMGVGMLKGAQPVSYKRPLQISIGWIATLGVTIILSAAIAYSYIKIS
ncbi:MAG: inorganic phosphate transporter [Elusimicrobia bacterium]|nr:inorganic phosphate transporter [Elusimicrobiota bacterium]